MPPFHVPMRIDHFNTGKAAAATTRDYLRAFVNLKIWNPIESEFSESQEFQWDTGADHTTIGETLANDLGLSFGSDDRLLKDLSTVAGCVPAYLIEVPMLFPELTDGKIRRDLVFSMRLMIVAGDGFKRRLLGFTDMFRSFAVMQGRYGHLPDYLHLNRFYLRKEGHHLGKDLKPDGSPAA